MSWLSILVPFDVSGCLISVFPSHCSGKWGQAEGQVLGIETYIWKILVTFLL